MVHVLLFLPKEMFWFQISIITAVGAVETDNLV